MLIKSIQYVRLLIGVVWGFISWQPYTVRDEL